MIRKTPHGKLEQYANFMSTKERVGSGLRSEHAKLADVFNPNTSPSNAITWHIVEPCELCHYQTKFWQRWNWKKNPCAWPQPLHAKQQHFRKWSVTTDISYITASCKFRHLTNSVPFAPTYIKRKHIISLVTNLHPQQKRKHYHLISNQGHKLHPWAQNVCQLK